MASASIIFSKVPIKLHERQITSIPSYNVETLFFYLKTLFCYLLRLSLIIPLLFSSEAAPLNLTQLSVERKGQHLVTSLESIYIFNSSSLTTEQSSKCFSFYPGFTSPAPNPRYPVPNSCHVNILLSYHSLG